jgi:hypothetical protein
MTIDERIEALTHSVELIAAMQQTTEKNLQRTGRNLDRLTREMRLFRHFVLAMGADIESRLLKLEGKPESEDEPPQS